MISQGDSLMVLQYEIRGKGDIYFAEISMNGELNQKILPRGPRIKG